MWGAVLIPMWLRRHDVASENRSAERFGQAMRVLSRREGSDARRESVAPTSARQPVVAAAPTSSRTTRPVSSGPVTTTPATAARRTPAPARSPRREARAHLARRRARTLLALGLLAVALGVLAVLSVVPVWAPLLAGLLLAGFVVNLRVQAKRSAERRRRGARPVPARPADRSVGRPAPQPDTGSERAATSRALVVEAKGQPLPSTSAAPGAEAGAPAATGADGDPIWQPNPMPLPTYVTAPKAVRPIRVIDLTTPGAWTSGRLLEDEVPVVEDTLAAADADAEALDALLEHDVAVDEAGSRSHAPRRAVND
jgi:hypothetical protein